MLKKSFPFSPGCLLMNLEVIRDYREQTYLLEFESCLGQHVALVLDGTGGLYWASAPFYRLLHDLNCNQIHKASLICPR